MSKWADSTSSSPIPISPCNQHSIGQSPKAPVFFKDHSGTASRLQSPAIFESQTKLQGISEVRSKCGHFHRRSHRNHNRIVTAKIKSGWCNLVHPAGWPKPGLLNRGRGFGRILLFFPWKNGKTRLLDRNFGFGHDPKSSDIGRALRKSNRALLRLSLLMCALSLYLIISFCFSLPHSFFLGNITIVPREKAAQKRSQDCRKPLARPTQVTNQGKK